MLIDRPNDPITYLIDFLKKDADGLWNKSSFFVENWSEYDDLVPQIVILGPPASGRHTIGKLLQKKNNAVLLECEDILRDAPSKLRDKLPPNPTVVWIEICFRREK